MAKFDPGYSFRSSDFRSQPDRWQQRGRPSAPTPPVPADGHECARGRWCSSAKNVEQPDGTIRRVPGFTYQVFCQACTDKTIDVLRELPAAYGRLEEEYGSPVRRNDHAIRTPFGPSILIRLAIDALQREMPVIIAQWAARVRVVPGLQLSAAKHAPGTPEGFAEACKVLRLHLEPLFSLQPYRMTRVYSLPLDEDTAALIADEEIIHAGDDFVSVQVPRDGAHAGNEILDLQWRSAATLGELRSKPQELLGVPCRADGCGRMALVRAEPPSDPDDPGDYSVCLKCRARMDEDTYRAWVDLCAAYERHRRTVPTLENLPGVA